MTFFWLQGLEVLPVELLYEIQLYALSSSLPYVSHRLFDVYQSSPTSFRCQYLAACATRELSPPSKFLSKCLRYPICSVDVFKSLFRKQAEKGDMPLIDLPRRLFRRLTTRRVESWSESDEPLTFLRALAEITSSRINVNSHQGYALTRAVHVRFMPLVAFLLAHDASPHWKDGLAIMVAIHQKDLNLVKRLLESDRPISRGKRLCTPDGIQVTSKMLKTAVQCKAHDIVQYLIREKGCIADMQTLTILMQYK
ncbi:hypothetical protein FISHEDRAFT_77485 [Fistulina hepatica ATCC 64428]|uniref:Ankyrin n=1 Tax=Fistulina hepatica ATCC 64428 TaxID=1128425 RepID=A0A0D7A2H3_9AGAR|nr:hypothetical protein FISHEDRAFT_77485 [Fistulina hepatica ATCC 64428]